MSDKRFSNVSTLVLKVTDRCNMDCQYCYEKVNVANKDMPIQMFQDLVEATFQNSNSNRIHLLFHGGEPTLLHVSWYQKAAKSAIAIASNYGKEVSFGIQTNLLRISKDLERLFIRYGFSIGVSLDGTLVEGQRSFNPIVFKNLKRLKSRKIPFGILATINKSNFDKFPQFISWMEQELEVRIFKANVAYPVSAGKFQSALNPLEMLNAQKAIIDYMLDTDFRIIESNLFEELQWVTGKLPRMDGLCSGQTCGAGSKVIGFNHLGGILPCGRFEWNNSKYSLGELSTPNPDFEELLSEFHGMFSENWSDCDRCDARKICRSGCQAFIVRSQTKRNIECSATKMRYAYYETIMDKIEQSIDRLDLKKPGFINDNYSDSYSGEEDDSYSDTIRPPVTEKRGIKSSVVAMTKSSYSDSSYSDSYSDGW